jgi:hypothetical protein
LGLFVGLLGVWSCGGPAPVESPILTLAQLPAPQISLIADREQSGQTNLGVGVRDLRGLVGHGQHDVFLQMKRGRDVSIARAWLGAGW